MLRAPSLGLALALSLAPLTGVAQTATPLPPPAPAALPPPPPPPTTTTLTPPTTATPTPPATNLQARWAEGPRQRRRSLLRDRLRLLDTSIIPLAERSRDARRTEGIINLVIGAGIFGLGFAYSALSDAPGVTPTQALLWVQGGYTALTGAVQLLWVPSRERLSEQYATQPRRTPHERRLRVRFGEQALDDMAADGRRRRVLAALAGVGFSVASLGIIYRDQIFDGQPWPEPPAFNYLVIGLVGLSMIANIIPVFSASPEERLRDAYRREVRILREAQDD